MVFRLQKVFFWQAGGLQFWISLFSSKYVNMSVSYSRCRTRALLYGYYFSASKTVSPKICCLNITVNGKTIKTVLNHQASKAFSFKMGLMFIKEQFQHFGNIICLEDGKELSKTTVKSLLRLFLLPLHHLLCCILMLYLFYQFADVFCAVKRDE